jgi:hypothetical protein
VGPILLDQSSALCQYLRFQHTPLLPPERMYTCTLSHITETFRYEPHSAGHLGYYPARGSHTRVAEALQSHVCGFFCIFNIGNDTPHLFNPSSVPHQQREDVVG